MSGVEQAVMTAGLTQARTELSIPGRNSGPAVRVACGEVEDEIAVKTEFFLPPTIKAQGKGFDLIPRGKPVREVRDVPLLRAGLGKNCSEVVWKIQVLESVVGLMRLETIDLGKVNVAILENFDAHVKWNTFDALTRHTFDLG